MKKRLEFRTWQRKWLRSKKSLFRKTKQLSMGGIDAIKRLSTPYIDQHGYVLDLY